MTNKSYVMTTYKGEKAYNYFRTPPYLREFFGKSVIRLDDNRDIAEVEAKEILAGLPIGSREEPSAAEITAARKMLTNAKGRSKKREWPVEMTVEEIIGMMRRQAFRCSVTLLPFDLNWRKESGAARNAYAPSLDRIDNAKGYSVDNCRVVLSAVNYAMNEWGLENYVKIATAAARHGLRAENQKNG